MKFKSDVVMFGHKECVGMSYWLCKLNSNTDTTDNNINVEI